MDLSILYRSINSKTAIAFDLWLEENRDILSDFFYITTGLEFVEMKFDLSYYQEIFQSKIYQGYHKSKTAAEPFLFFIELLGIAAEKLAEVGSSSVAKTIVLDLPDSPSRYRLRALNEFSSVEDIRTSYVQKFPEVLLYLDKSRLLFEEGSLRPIVDVLAFYFSNAKKVLTESGLSGLIYQIEDLFKDSGTIKKYPFLGHQILTDLIAGKAPFALNAVVLSRGCLTPSAEIKSLFSQFNRDYYSHPQVNDALDNLWGNSRKYILDNILVRGRGDFTISTGKITAADKVMLYCYYNLKKHFFTSYAVFENVIGSLNAFFRNNEYTPVFIDLGCGPMTSGLALADLIHLSTGSGINMTYIGIDISTAMTDKAKTLTKLPIFSASCNFEFHTNWNKIKASVLKRNAGKNNPVIFNASYLFASSSVDPFDLANFVSQVSKNYANVYFIFQNPNRVDRNLKYEEFKNALPYETILSNVENVRYMAASREANEDVAYEILKIVNL